MPKKKLHYLCSRDFNRYRDQILDLHRREYGTVSENFYDTFYHGNPLGDPLLGLCFDGELLVGQENYFFQRIAEGKRVCSGAIGINTIVDSRYRLFYGIFKKLVQLTMDELRGAADALGAHPNEASKKYYLANFGWQVGARVGLYKKFIGRSGTLPERMLALLRPGRIHTAVRLVQASRFDPQILNGIIARHAASASYARFHKTAEFLNWKFLDSACYACDGYYIESQGRPRGYVVTCKKDHELLIADFLIENDDPDFFTATLSTLASLGVSLDKRRLVICAHRDCWYYPLIRKYFFFRRWEFDFITARLGNTADCGTWLVQAGDFDIM